MNDSLEQDIAFQIGSSDHMSIHGGIYDVPAESLLNTNPCPTNVHRYRLP